MGKLAASSLIPGSPLFERGLETLAVSASLEQSRVLVQFCRQVLEPLGSDWVFVDSSQRIQVRHKPSNTRLRVLSSSGKRALGLANFKLIFGDEPGSWEVRQGQLLWDAVRTSLGKLPGQRVILAGTRAPAEDGSWWPELLKVPSGRGRFVQAVAAPESHPWDAWQTIRKANPDGELQPDPAQDDLAGAGRGPPERNPAPGV